MRNSKRARRRDDGWRYRHRRVTGLLAAVAIVFICHSGAMARNGAGLPNGGFSIPLACGERRPCIIQYYMDRDPGSDFADYRCGKITFDGHSGTDFRLRHTTEMLAGVAVLAAAAGRVVEARDEFPDVPAVSQTAVAEPDPLDGNSVVIDHGGGWQTRYDYLRQGSLQVVVGEPVERGSVLGQVGLPSHANFPHLHFEVLHDGRAVDPFSGPRFQGKCGHKGHSLWQPAARERLVYRQGGVLDAAFSSQTLTPAQIREGPARLRLATPDSERLLFWATAWSLRRGDRDRIAIIDPNGRLLIDSTRTLEQNKEDWVRYVTVPRPANGWPKGSYRGIFEVKRARDDGEESVVIDTARFLAIE